MRALSIRLAAGRFAESPEPRRSERLEGKLWYLRVRSDGKRSRAGVLCAAGDCGGWLASPTAPRLIESSNNPTTRETCQQPTVFEARARGRQWRTKRRTDESCVIPCGQYIGQ